MAGDVEATTGDDLDTTTTAAQAVFYNMTGDDLQVQVNPRLGNATETVSAIPTSSPYTPNHSANTYTRVNAAPQQAQFGNDNTLVYGSEGGLGISVEVEIKVDGTTYAPRNPLLIFMFSTAAVVTCPAVDSVPYVGHDGETINVKPGATTL